MEMADGMLINKADGDNLINAKRAKREYQSALHLFPPHESGSAAKVEICSGLNAQNLDKAWQLIENYLNTSKSNGFFENHRKEQVSLWFTISIEKHLHRSLFSSTMLQTKIQLLEIEVTEKRISPTAAAEQMFEEFKKALHEKS